MPDLDDDDVEAVPRTCHPGGRGPEALRRPVAARLRPRAPARRGCRSRASTSWGPDRRTVSPRVSLHAALLSLDVVSDDGSYVGRNHDGTVDTLAGRGRPRRARQGDRRGARRPRRPRRPELAASTGGTRIRSSHRPRSAGQVCLLQDMADIRNHRHHGLVGALVVLPAGHTPQDADGDEAGAARKPGSSTARARPWRTRRSCSCRTGCGCSSPATRPSRCATSCPATTRRTRGRRASATAPSRCTRARSSPIREPHTPTMEVPVDKTVWLRVVSAADKPRNHTFTVHGVSWPSAPRPGAGPRAGAVGGITAGSVHDLVFDVEARGDHAVPQRRVPVGGRAGDVGDPAGAVTRDGATAPTARTGRAVPRSPPAPGPSGSGSPRPASGGRRRGTTASRSAAPSANRGALRSPRTCRTGTSTVQASDGAKDHRTAAGSSTAKNPAEWASASVSAPGTSASSTSGPSAPQIARRNRSIAVAVPSARASSSSGAVRAAASSGGRSPTVAGSSSATDRRSARPCAGELQGDEAAVGVTDHVRPARIPRWGAALAHSRASSSTLHAGRGGRRGGSGAPTRCAAGPSGQAPRPAAGTTSRTAARASAPPAPRRR